MLGNVFGVGEWGIRGIGCTRGLRQGDHLFPHLFLLVIDWLGKLLGREAQCWDD